MTAPICEPPLDTVVDARAGELVRAELERWVQALRDQLARMRVQP